MKLCILDSMAHFREGDPVFDSHHDCVGFGHLRLGIVGVAGGYQLQAKSDCWRFPTIGKISEKTKKGTPMAIDLEKYKPAYEK